MKILVYATGLNTIFKINITHYYNKFNHNKACTISLILSFLYYLGTVYKK